MKTITPKGGDQPRKIGRFGSVSEAARFLGMTRQSVKQMFAEVDAMETDQKAFAEVTA